MNERPVKRKMYDAQPAWMLSDKDETANVGAVRRLLSRPGLRPERLFEFFGGLGRVTRMAMEVFPGVPIETWDMDDRCCEELRSIGGGVEVRTGDSLSDLVVTERSGVLMDFNVWTVLKARTVYADVMDRVMAARPRWVQVTDSALSKLHLNYASYGAAAGTWDSYREVLREWARAKGWVLVGEERAHHKTVMVLFKPVGKK
jgi:hypothetical protein